MRRATCYDQVTTNTDHPASRTRGRRRPPIPNAYWLPNGTIAAGEYPGAGTANRTRERLGHFLDAGLQSFVDLTRPEDPLDPYDANLSVESAKRGIETRYVRFGIPDMGVTDIDSMERMCSRSRMRSARCRRAWRCDWVSATAACCARACSRTWWCSMRRPSSTSRRPRSRTSCRPACDTWGCTACRCCATGTIPARRRDAWVAGVAGAVTRVVTA